MYRISELMRLNHHLYHTGDLAVLWQITNKNTLYTTIKRYVQKGLLIPVHKGLYSTLPLSRLDPEELGKAIIHRFTYLSTESVLSRAGIIAQPVYIHTFVSDLYQKITVGSNSFLFRQLKDEYLHNPAGLINRDGILTASVERAVADMLYFNPKYHLDLPGLVDFKQVKIIQTAVGYPCKN